MRHGARTDATMWRVANRMYPGDRHPMRARARCHLYRSPVLHTPPFIHAVLIRMRAECLSCATRNVQCAHVGAGRWGTHIGAASGCKHRAMCPQSTRRRVGARTSGRQVGASAERCIYNRRDGAVRGGDTHLESASGHTQGDVRTSDTRAWGT